jgi:hypothetical protein
MENFARKLLMHRRGLVHPRNSL